MKPDIFAEWLKRQGYTIFKTKSSYWYNQAPRTFQAFPYHWLIEPEDEELSDFLKKQKGIGLRYSSPLSAKQGKISYHAVYEKSKYDYDDLGKWARKNVRRGLSNCIVEPISFERLAEDGYELQIDTLNRQGRNLEITPAIWRNRCLSASDLPGFTGWGAFVDSKLAASVITFEMEDCGYMLYQQCKRCYLEDHVNNALGFVVTQFLLNRTNIKSILYGLHSLDAPASVDEFKFRMGYVAKPVRQRVVFNPASAPFFNKLTYSGLSTVHKIFPDNPTFAKAEGMMRFYLQGKLPITKQKWPEVLLDQKEDILSKQTSVL